MNQLSRILAITLSLSATAPLLAQEAEDHSNLTVGVGVAAIPSYEGSDSSRTIVGPQLRGKLHDYAFWTRGPALFVDAVPNRDDNGIDLQLGPVLGARFDRSSRKAINDRAVEALGKRDVAIEVGGFVGVGKTGIITSAYDNLSARVAVTKDVAGAHESYIVTPAIEYFTPLSIKSFVGIALSADYVGKKFGRYYFDVTPAQAIASGLPAYGNAGSKSGFRRANANITGGYSLSGDIRRGWTIFALGGYSRMLGRYADSPVVAIAGSKDQWIGALGVGYTF